DQQTLQTLERARRLLDEGWRKNDTVKLAEAVAEADKAAKVAHRGDANEAVCVEAEELLLQTQVKAEQAQKHTAFLAALLDVSVRRETARYERTASGQMAALAEPSAEEQFATAFRRWDSSLDLDRMPLEEVLKRVQAQPPPVVEEVIAGLEAWMLQRRQ